MMQQVKDAIVYGKIKPENGFDEDLEKVPSAARKWVRSPEPAIPSEAVQPVDLVRDHRAISEANDAGLSEKAKPESQWAEQIGRVHSVAREWLRSPDPAVRTFAVQLGLEWGSLPEFIDPALDLVTLGSRSAGAAARPLAQDKHRRPRGRYRAPDLGHGQRRLESGGGGSHNRGGGNEFADPVGRSVMVSAVEFPESERNPQPSKKIHFTGFISTR